MSSHLRLLLVIAVCISVTNGRPYNQSPFFDPWAFANFFLTQSQSRYYSTPFFDPFAFVSFTMLQNQRMFGDMWRQSYYQPPPPPPYQPLPPPPRPLGPVPVGPAPIPQHPADHSVEFVDPSGKNYYKSGPGYSVAISRTKK